MDENFVENLGMSAHVDEGLWDRLKSRAASFTQGAKNLSGGKLGGVGTTESAKFNSLFRSFVAEELSLIKSLDKAVVPWAKHFTPEEASQVQQIEALEQALKKIDFGKLPVTEALPSFSNLGARWAGGVQNMLDSYKKRMADTYDNFIKDVTKLNIVPEQYITRKIAASKSGAFEALKALEPVIGKPTTTGIRTPTATPAAAPTTSAPATPVTTTPAPSPAPSPAAAPSAPPPKPATAAPAPAPAPVAPAPKPAAPSAQQSQTAKMAQKAIHKIINQLLSGKMLDDIEGYIKRDATKAEVPFPPTPPIVSVYPDGTEIVWHLRYKNSREIQNNLIQVLAEVRTMNPETGKKETGKRSNWEDFMRFGASDVIDINGHEKKNFDILRNIKMTNPAIGKEIENGLNSSGETIDPSLGEQMAKAFAGVIRASVPKPERGERRLSGPETPEKIGSGPGTPEPPIEGPKTKEKMVNPPPEKQARVEKIPPPASAPEPEKKAEPTKVSGPTSAPVSSEPTKSKEPEKPEEPSSKLKDLVPKDGKEKVKATPEKAARKPTPKKATPKPAPKKAAVPDKSVAPAAPVAAAPKKPVVAPAAPKAEPTPSAEPTGKSIFGTDEERLKRFNARWTVPNKLPPLTSIEQMNKFRSALGSEENPPSWKVEFAYQQATGQNAPQKPSAPAPKAAKVTKPRQKMTEVFEATFKDFFPL